MTKNYLEEIECKEPNQSTIDFILSYSKAIAVTTKRKVKLITVLN